MQNRTDYFLTDTNAESPAELLVTSEHTAILDFIVCTIAQNIPPESFAVRGMYPISKMIPDCRVIYDLDIIVKSVHTIIKLGPILRRIGTALQTSGNISKLVMNDTDKGFRDGMLTYNADGTPFINIQLDIDDLTSGVVWAHIAGVDIQLTSPERSLADSLISTWSDRRSRRIGDFYDAYHIMRSLQIDGVELRKALEAKGFKHGKVCAFTEQELYDVYKAFNKAKFKNMLGKNIKTPAFSDVALVYGEFCIQFCIGWKLGSVERLALWNFEDMSWAYTFPNPLDTELVWGTITGPSSLAYNGLTHYDNLPVTLLATKAEMDGRVFGQFSFVTVEWENEDSNFKTVKYPNWRMPTVDKAISDYMLALDIFEDEELLVEAISDFMRSNPSSEVERLKSYCTAHNNSSFKISQYFADAASMLEY